MKRKTLDITEFLLITGIFICLNVVFSNYFTRWDFTEDKRYSVAPVTKELLNDLQEPVYVTVYLEGDISSDYQRLSKAVKEKLDEFQVYAGDNIQYRFVDPSAEEDPAVRNRVYNQLVQAGIQPRYVVEETGGTREEKYLFPGAILSFQNKEVPVTFLGRQKKAMPLSEELNQAVEGVEYQLVSGLRKLIGRSNKSVAFIEGHGELPQEEVQDISATLSDFYNVERIKIGEVEDPGFYDVMIVASPDSAYSDKDKFLLDQYVMKGGSVLFLLDALNVYEDSLVTGVTYAIGQNTNLDDLLFRYGIRINNNLIQDLQSGLVLVNTGVGGQMQTVEYPFYPVLNNFADNPVVKNLNVVKSRFVSTIDTVKATGVTKTPLMWTTKDTKVLPAPVEIDLDDLRQSLDPQQFNAGNLPVMYLLEGEFESLYNNRSAPVNIDDRRNVSERTSVIVASDGDLIRSEYDPAKKEYLPLGQDRETGFMFSNEQLILNAVDYLAGEDVVNIRSKDIEMRPLDKDRIYAEATQWQVVNILLPILFVVVFAIGRYYLRKKKYTNFQE